MKKYMSALLMMIASLVAYHFIHPFLPRFLDIIVWSAILVAFGYFLNNQKSKSHRWVGKVIISLVIIAVVGYRLEWISIPFFSFAIPYFDLVLIYCGWSFYQV